MSLAGTKDLLLEARKSKRAVGAFSVSSIDMILGVIRAAEELKTPVLLQVAECRLNASPLHIIGSAMIAAAKEAKVPVAVHLDHGLTLDCVRQAIDLGFSSVMIDGSALSMDENIALTRKVVDMAHPKGVAVEAEIGRVGKTESGEDAPAMCADPDEAARFVRETDVDALAVAIGNAHGVYVGTPQLRFDILEKVGELTDIPLVLHGGTGISDEDFRHCVALGMNKINIATASFMAATGAAQGAKGYFDMAQRIQDAVYEVAKHHIGVFGIQQ